MGTREVGTNVTGKAGFNSKAKGSHDLIACRYFSFTSRAIVETNDMISRYDPVLSLSGIRSIFLITILLCTGYCIVLLYRPRSRSPDSP